MAADRSNTNRNASLGFSEYKSSRVSTQVDQECQISRCRRATTRTSIAPPHAIYNTESLQLPECVVNIPRVDASPPKLFRKNKHMPLTVSPLHNNTNLAKCGAQQRRTKQTDSRTENISLVTDGQSPPRTNCLATQKETQKAKKQ